MKTILSQMIGSLIKSKMHFINETHCFKNGFLNPPMRTMRSTKMRNHVTKLFRDGKKEANQ